MSNTIPDSELDTNISDRIRQQYYYLVSHIDSLMAFLHEYTQLNAEVFVLPKPNVSDVGKEIAHFDVQHVKGIEAVSRALHHFADDKLKVDQAGVMANRMPGVIKVSTEQPDELVKRIARINEEKDTLMNMIRTGANSSTDQFLLTKSAIPYGIRKAIGRHIYVYEQDSLKSLSFSVSKRSSMSKVQNRDFWLKKLEASQKYTPPSIRQDGFDIQIEIERKVLSSLPETALLRTVRPIRRTPIMNILYQTGQKASQVAHSPVFVVNDSEVKVNPMKSYNIKAVDEDRTEPLIARWHLYQYKKND